MNARLGWWVAAGSAAALALLGCLFCWRATVDVESTAPLEMIIWLIVGVALCALCRRVSWSRWLAIAPWLGLVGGIGLLVDCLCPGVLGRGGCLPLGPLSLNLKEFLPLILALFSVWLSRRLRLGLFCSILLFVAILYLVGGTALVLRGGLPAGFGGLAHGTAQGPSVLLVWRADQLMEAFTDAKWFSGENWILHEVPDFLTFGMPATAALAFGKWYIAFEGLLFVSTYLGIVAVGVRSREPSKRLFTMIFESIVLSSAFVGYAGFYGLVPVGRCYIPLVSFGSSAAVTGALLGVLGALQKDVEATRDGAPAAPVPHAGV